MGFSRKTVDFLAGMNKHRNILLKGLNIPLLGSLIKRLMDTKSTVFTYIPVNESIAVESGVALPVSIAEHFIREASHRIILNYCPCRRAMNCSKYDQNTGCIFLGDGASEITTPDVGKEVNIEEALLHLQKSVNGGLVPVVGKVRFDAGYLGVKNHHRLMTICVCCPCCCLASGITFAPKDVRNLMVKLEGVTVNVSDACRGCGKCTGICIFKQIEIINGKAVIGEECKGCGRCADICPNGAVSIRIDNPDYIKQSIKRISNYVDVKEQKF